MKNEVKKKMNVVWRAMVYQSHRAESVSDKISSAQQSNLPDMRRARSKKPSDALRFIRRFFAGR
jgi:hypothetical protein